MPFNTRKDGTKFQTVQAEMRGDTCYAGKRGHYWHNLDDQGAIDVSSVTGPFGSAELAYKAAHAQRKPRTRRTVPVTAHGKEGPFDTILSEATLDQLFLAQDAASKWACVPGRVADKMRQVVQQVLQAEVDARLEVG